MSVREIGAATLATSDPMAAGRLVLMHSERTAGAVDDAFGHWLAGFIDGEGCFCITYRGPDSRNKVCMLSVALRGDDRPILDEIRRRTGIGKVYNSPGRGRTKPYARWVVQNQPDVLQAVELLTRYPLRSKKARDFEIWRSAVEVWCSGGRGHRADPSRWARMEALRQQLVTGRAYAHATGPSTRRSSA